MSTYAPCERETIIIMNDEDYYAIISTYQKSMHRKLLKLSGEYPDVFSLMDINEEFIEDSCTEVTVPKDWIKIRPPKKMNLTEQQRKVMAERFANRTKLI